MFTYSSGGQLTARLIECAKNNEEIYSCQMLDVTRLRVLVAVARYGSVTAAARALNYAQPSISHRYCLAGGRDRSTAAAAGRPRRAADRGRPTPRRAR